MEISLCYKCVPKILMICLEFLSVTDRLKIVIMGHFLPFFLHFPLKHPKIRILKKRKKLLDISSFYTCLPNPESYEVRLFRVRHAECFVIWAIFFRFFPLTTHKIKTLQKLKKHLEMLSFYTCVPKITIGVQQT